MAKRCGNVCEENIDDFTFATLKSCIDCLRQSVQSVCKLGKKLMINKNGSRIHIKNFRNGLHEHWILHVWRCNVFLGVLLGVVGIAALRIAVYKSLVNLQKTYLKLLLDRRILWPTNPVPSRPVPSTWLSDHLTTWLNKLNRPQSQIDPSQPPIN